MNYDQPTIQRKKNFLLTKWLVDFFGKQGNKNRIFEIFKYPNFSLSSWIPKNPAQYFHEKNEGRNDIQALIVDNNTNAMAVKLVKPPNSSKIWKMNKWWNILAIFGLFVRLLYFKQFFDLFLSKLGVSSVLIPFTFTTHQSPR